jgi:hypothetical protein
MSALPPKADMDQSGCDVRFVPKADVASLNRSPRLRRCFGDLFPRRYEGLQCDSRKAIFSATYKAKAINAECNPLVWKRIFMALLLGMLQVT